MHAVFRRLLLLFEGIADLSCICKLPPQLLILPLELGRTRVFFGLPSLCGRCQEEWLRTLELGHDVVLATTGPVACLATDRVHQIEDAFVKESELLVLEAR
jgi:hypothetical protein